MTTIPSASPPARPAPSSIRPSTKRRPRASREGRPTVFVHPEDMAGSASSMATRSKLGSARGVVTLHAQADEGLRRGVLIAESIWPNEAFEDGGGINTLTGADQPAPAGAAPSTT